MILPEFPPAIGGMQTHAHYLSAHLSQQGHDLRIYTYQGATTFRQEEAQAFDHALGIPVHREMSRIGYFHNLELLEAEVRRFRPDLIYSSTVFYGILSQRTGIPVVCRSVGNDVMRPWIAYPYELASGALSNWRLERPLFDFFRKVDTPELIEMVFRERRLSLMADAARAATRILANSHFTQGLLEEVGVARQRIEVVVGGVEASRFGGVPRERATELKRRLGLAPDTTVLMTACRLVDKKAVDFLLTTFAGVDPARRRWHLLVIGQGRRAQKLEQLAHSLGIGGQVTFTGPVPHQQIHDYFAMTDVFVLASRVHQDPLTGLRDAETMGRVLLEANAAGVPVVAASSGGIPSVVAHGVNGLLFQPDHAPDLVRQIEAVLQQPRLTQEITRQGRILARTRFDWAHVLEAHETSFYHVLGIERAAQEPRPAGKPIPASAAVNL